MFEKKVAAEVSPQSQELIALAQRKNNPVIHLFTYYATGINPSKNYSPHAYWYETNLARLRKADFFGYGQSHQLRGMPDTNNYSPDENAKIDDVLQGYREDQNVYAREVMSEPHISEMMNVLNIIASAEPLPHHGIKDYTHEEAQQVMRGKMQLTYGTDWERNVSTDPNLRNTFLRGVFALEETPNPLTRNNREPLTIEQVEGLYNGQIRKQTDEVLKDLISLGAEIYVADPYAISTFEDVPQQLTEDDIADLQHTPLRIQRHGKDVGIIDRNEHKSYVFAKRLHKLLGKYIDVSRHLYTPHSRQRFDYADLSYIFDDFIASQKMLNQDTIDQLFKLRTRVDLISYFQSERNTLTGSKGVGNFSGKESIMVFEPLIRDIGEVLVDVQEEPRIIFDRFERKNQRTPLLNQADEIVNYIKWQVLRRTTQGKEFPEMPVVNPFDSDNAISTLLQSSETISNLLDHFKNTDLPAKFLAASAGAVGSLPYILLEAYKTLFNPPIVVEGHPLRHMRYLSKVKELSTYPDDPDLPFKDYVLPGDVKKKDEVIISTTGTIYLGYDQDGQLSAQVYAPEYSRISNISVNSTNQNLEHTHDFHLQYEGKTGHYRIVFTTTGKEKLRQTGHKVKYKAAVDTTRLVEDATILTPKLELENIVKLGEFAARLEQRGYHRIADELLDLIEDSQRTGAKINTVQLEKAILAGSRYIYSVEQQAQEAEDFSYLPPADSKGRARLQCSHSATLFSEMLNTIFEEGEFYPSVMMNTFNRGWGVVFAGLPHSDTRGRVENQRVRHDATPSPTALSFSEIFKNDELNIQPEMQEAQINTEIAVKLMQDIIRERSTQIVNEYIQSVLDHSPIDRRNGQPILGHDMPDAPKELGEVLDQIRKDVPQLFENSEHRHEVLKRLAKLKETWALSHDISISPQNEAAFRQLFGQYRALSSTSIFIIDELNSLIRSIKE